MGVMDAMYGKYAGMRQQRSYTVRLLVIFLFFLFAFPFNQP